MCQCCDDVTSELSPPSIYAVIRSWRLPVSRGQCGSKPLISSVTSAHSIGKVPRGGGGGGGCGFDSQWCGAGRLGGWLRVWLGGGTDAGLNVMTRSGKMSEKITMEVQPRQISAAPHFFFFLVFLSSFLSVVSVLVSVCLSVFVFVLDIASVLIYR